MDLQSPKRHSDLQEIVIKTTGFEGHIFKAKMPFSWLIWQQVTEIMKTSVPVQDRGTDQIILLLSSPWMVEKTKLEIKEIICEEYWQYLCAGQLPSIGGVG